MPPAAGRIDVHAHAVPPVFRTALAAELPPGKARSPAWTPELALEGMDGNGITSALLSLSTPGTHLGDDGRARLLSRHCNEYFAELRDRPGKRFGAFAAVPLPDVEGACREAEHALDILKLDGIGVFSNYDGKHLGDAEFDPLLERLNERAAVVFIHPTHNCLCEAVHPNVPPTLVEYPFDTTRAAINLIVSGAMDRFPRIRFILAHAGGTLPYLAWRISRTLARHFSLSLFPDRYPQEWRERNAANVTPDFTMSRLRRFWYDTALAPGPEVFGSLLTVANRERILFGTDTPYAADFMIKEGIEILGATDFLDAPLRAAIARSNALQLFPRLG